MRDITTQAAVTPPVRLPSIPDWSHITSEPARKALEDIFVAGRWDWRLGGIDAQSARVLAAALRLYAVYGRPPSASELLGAVPMSAPALKELLARLANHDLLLLGPDHATITGAYPFIERVTGHEVTFEKSGKTLNTMCAIDALGAGAMCRENLRLRSICRSCGEGIVAHVGSQGMTLHELRPAQAVVWVGLRQSCGCAADTLCTELLLFCSRDHLTRWRSQGHGSDGHVLTAQEGFQVGKALFSDRAMMSGPDGVLTAAAGAADQTAHR